VDLVIGVRQGVRIARKHIIKMHKWVNKTWFCGCGAMNAGWLNKCGKCKKKRYGKSND